MCVNRDNCAPFGILMDILGMVVCVCGGGGGVHMSLIVNFYVYFNAISDNFENIEGEFQSMSVETQKAR